VINTRERFGNGRRVGNHANSTLDLGQVAVRDQLRRLVVDSALETGRAPVHKLNGALGLDRCNSSVHVLGNNITTVHEAARHVFSVTGITLGHHVGRLKDRVGNLGNRETLVVGLFLTNDGSIRSKHEMDARVRHQVRLELGNIHIQGTIETQGSREGGNHLGNQAVQVGVRGALNVQVALANVVERLVIEAKGAIGVLQKRMGREDRVVRFHDSRGHTRGRRNGKGELRLAAIVDRQALQKKTSETRTGSTPSGVEDQESLQSGAVIRQLADTVQDRVYNLLANGVVSAGIIIGSVFLAIDNLLGVVQLTVGSAADFVTDTGLEIDVDGTGDVLSALRLAKERVEGIIRASDNRVVGHGAIGENAVLEAVKLPALVSSLDTGLTEVDRDAF